MGRDKRQYRFVQDTRYGRAVLAESYEVPALVEAITRYVARRLVERERALTDDAGRGVAQSVLRRERHRRHWRAVRTFIFGLIAGVAALFALAMLSNPHSLADQHEALLLCHLARGREAAGYQLAFPGTACAIDPVQIVSGGVLIAAKRG